MTGKHFVSRIFGEHTHAVVGHVAVGVKLVDAVALFGGNAIVMHRVKEPVSLLKEHHIRVLIEDIADSAVRFVPAAGAVA